MGDGKGGSAGRVEPQYATAKTSVWWDIENCQVPRGCDPHAIAKNISSALVKMNYCGPITICAYGDTTRIPVSAQHALSSTGIALNHVPAGIKDASDKRILVDMLFWAVDNPAPANYLLISGDRDFSNALHQLRMRRYNILLAQPVQASVALVAAAKCVWLWTSLVYGGPPFTANELPNVIGASKKEMVHSSAYDKTPSNQPACTTNAATLSLGGQKLSVSGRIGDGTFTVPSAPQSPNKTGMTSLPSNLEESKQMLFLGQQESAPVKKFMKAPHEFFSAAVSSTTSASILFPGNIDTSSSNSNYLTANLQNHSIQPQLPYLPDKLIFSNSHVSTFQSVPSRSDGPRVSTGSSVALPDIGKLRVSLNPNNSFLDYTGDYKSMSQSMVSDNSDKKYPLSSNHAVPPNNNVHGNGVWGSQEGHPPPNVQGLIGVILIALNTLKVEKIAPTEANITDCIRYGDPKYRNIDVRKALDSALDQKMILKQHLGRMELYIGRVERLWNCENPVGGNTEQYPNATWAAIQNFLTSSAGSSALKASKCRYEAALILKNSCLTTLPLGEVLRVLNMIINIKQWIKHAHFGWQPITITLLETKYDSGNDI